MFLLFLFHKKHVKKKVFKIEIKKQHQTAHSVQVVVFMDGGYWKSPTVFVPSGTPLSYERALLSYINAHHIKGKIRMTLILNLINIKFRVSSALCLDFNVCWNQIFDLSKWVKMFVHIRYVNFFYSSNE